MRRSILALLGVSWLLFSVPATAQAAEVVPSCEGVYLEFCDSEDVEEVAAECRWREEVEGYPGAVEEEDRVIPAVAICWEVVRALRERERPQREREAEQRREAARERARERREWAHKPTVTRAIAKEFARRLMRKTEFGTWWLDCDRPGRINRTSWTCKVSIFYKCLRGRIRVTGAGIKNGRKYYRATGGELRPCRV